VTITRALGLSPSLLLVLAGAATTGAGEFQVNAHAPNAQSYPAISHDSSGAFVVVWQSYGQDGSLYGVFGRRFSSLGSPAGGEFQINQLTIGRQRSPVISHAPSGGFVAAWESYAQDGSLDGVFGRRFSAAGAPAGDEFQVNQYTTSYQTKPAVSQDSSGGFVVAWQSFGQDGASYGVFGRRFNSSGSPLGGEFQINVHTSSYQSNPEVSHDSSGGFVVVWQGGVQDGSLYGIFGRRFDSSGNAVGAEFQINQFTSARQMSPTIAHDSSDGFVVAWESFGQDGSGYGVFGRRFDSTGSPQGTEFQINAHTTSFFQRFPTISQDPSGGFVAAWHSEGQDGSGYGVFGRRFSSAGSALGADLQINQHTTNNQSHPAISHEPAGGFVLAWRSAGQDGSDDGVFARRVPRPSVAIDYDLVLEQQAGSSSAIFLVLLSEPPELEPLQLDYATADATASAGSDYTAASGTLTILPGQTWSFVTAPVLGDTLYEADEGFWMNLSSTGLAHLIDPSAVGLIINDDAPPSFAIQDLQMSEGNSGMSQAQFTVTISQASGLPARVDFSTFNGTAIAGEDYTTAGGELVFPAMSTASQTAVVLIHGDLQFEPDETFSVALANPVDATVADGLAVGTILNDDGNFLITTGAAAGGASLVRRYQGD